MYFEDINAMAFPNDANFFFDVNMICVGMPEGYICRDYTDVWDLSNVMESIPFALHVYSGETPEIKVENFSHCVVEISSLGIAWYKTRATKNL